MFGLLKENILTKLEKLHNSNKDAKFTSEFKKFAKIIYSDNVLKEFYEIYNLYKTVNFDDNEIAKEFVEESLKYLYQFDKTHVKKLESIMTLQETYVLPKKTNEFLLDQLIFNESINIKDKATYKVQLVRNITNRNKTSVDLNNIDTLYNKLTENVNQLTPEQKETLELFFENDEKKIINFYSGLINETHILVENNILNADNYNDVVKKLVEVKRRLEEMRKEVPDIEQIEKLLTLKYSFN